MDGGSRCKSRFIALLLFSEQIVVSVWVFGIVEPNDESDEKYNEYRTEYDAEYRQECNYKIEDCCVAGVVGSRSFPDSGPAGALICVKSRPIRCRAMRQIEGRDFHKYLAKMKSPADPPTSICKSRLPDPGSKYAITTDTTQNLSFLPQHDSEWPYCLKNCTRAEHSRHQSQEINPGRPDFRLGTPDSRNCASRRPTTVPRPPSRSVILFLFNDARTSSDDLPADRLWTRACPPDQAIPHIIDYDQ